jgi:cell division protein FtsI/penicillin-binding protein 2
MEGIECELDKGLSGVRGWLQTEKDRRGRELVALRQEDVEAKDGLNVVLTIDAGIQNILESEMLETFKKHNPNSIMGVVIRPRTGEILALANLPNFDPNRPGDSRDDARKNKAVTDMFEPGSTFKIVAISGALNEHLITLNDLFDCEHGHFSYANHILREHESAGYGSIPVETIMAKSSNIGAAKIGIKLGDQLLYQYIRAFGFGQKTEIRLPGEIKGWIHSPEKWSKLSMARIPIGQGVSVTPLQMTMAMSAIANQGMLMRPMIVDHLEDTQGQVVTKYQPMAVRQVIAPETTKQVLQALKAVVSTNGTAVKARLEYYTVAGKTGTAQKAENGIYTHKYLASFVGFFPADRPELCIGIMVDEPKGREVYGGQVAAPCFKNVAQRAANYLNIQTDAALLNPMVSTGLTRNSGLLAVKTTH